MRGDRADSSEGFTSLIAAAAAIEQRRPPDLLAALRAVSPEAMLRAAARHRCLGYLRHGIAELGIRDERASTLMNALRRYAGKAAIQAYEARRQLEQIVGQLSEAQVQFALLKGAARLFRGVRDAEWDTMFDFDILLPRNQFDLAVETLAHRGYRSANPVRLANYRARHHHFAPLQPPIPGLPVELHAQLAPVNSLSLSTDWAASEAYLERVESGKFEAQCFNTLGSAVHLSVHGLGIQRLHDVVLLAKILGAEPGLYQKLADVFKQEQRQSVALEAVPALAARIAGLRVSPAAPVERYVSWVQHRERLTPYVRERSQFGDAWFCNGGKIFGPATRYALPNREPRQSSISFLACFPYRLVGRLATSAYALASVARDPKPLR